MCLMPKWLINNYLDFIKAGFLLIFLHPVKTFAIRVKKQWSVKGIFNWCMLAAMNHSEYIECILFLCIGLSATGTLQFANDRAAYVFHGNGIWKSFLMCRLRKRACVRRFMLQSVWHWLYWQFFVFFGVIWPEYKEVPFSNQGRFIYGS